MSREMEESSNNFEGDFKVNLQTGEAFASLRVAGELCGVDKSSIHRYFATHDMPTKQGVTPEMLQKCNAHYAGKGKPEAIHTLAKLAEAGAKAFIYHKAGVPMQQQLVPLTSDTVELKKLEVTLELAKLESQIKLAEIEAKVKLGRKKTGIKRKPKCMEGYTTMKAFERTCEDIDEPIPISLLKGIRDAYSTQIDTRDNCVNEAQFNEAIDEVFGRFEVDGSYYRDPVTKIRTLQSKVDWYYT